jgi:lipopolysaccharide/colanic/teichoic acid biosynthesis glycosyltransferase
MSMFVITETLLQEKRSPGPPALRPQTARDGSWYVSAKTVFDFVLSLVLLVLTAPLVLLAMIVIKITSPGPVVYTQTRMGRDGKPFTIYKLRSMAHNAESLTGAQWSLPGDMRVTTVGRWLRGSHIDELPQLWNVLRGDMSLIGPRPERPEFLPNLEKAIPCYRQRLQVRPGVTGFAQVQLPPDTDLESVRIKLAYELYYLQHMGVWFDVCIYFATFGRVVGLSPQTLRACCRFVPRETVDADYRARCAATNLGESARLSTEGARC